ncbi:MAG: hypothetical protein KDC85_13125 [Saprospiraceae bacterium]|nr:hypothetical protein [Saprospiraceae bacterium]MCB9325501.1 alpha-amylase [Lewinellaceae bacterium]
MKLIKFFALLFFVSLIHFSCKKEDPTPPGDDGTTYTQYGTPFADVPATADIVMYEVNLRAFSQGGNLQGVIDRLDELKALGTNVIWLMPIYPIGQVNSVNSPYSVKDYKAVSPEYGTLESLQTLTDEAHARGMAIVLDWVANHTSWDNAWIENKTWYTQDASGNIIHPAGTNWMDVADLNFANTNMREAMIDAMEYWVFEANVDGFRCDYADGVPFDFWKQAIDELRSAPDRQLIFLAEGDRSDHYAAGFDMTYGWSFYGAVKSVFGGSSAGNLYLTHNSEYSGIPSGKQKLRFTTNHDESAWDKTPMVLFNGKKGALAASVMTIFMGGVPLFYTGQEVGRTSNVPFFSNSPINWNDNPDMLQAYQEIMAFYTQSEAAKTGTNTHYSDPKVVCFKKVSGNESLLVMVNARNSQSSFSLPAALQNTSWTNALTGEITELGSSLTLENYQYLLLTQ